MPCDSLAACAEMVRVAPKLNLADFARVITKRARHSARIAKAVPPTIAAIIDNISSRSL